MTRPSLDETDLKLIKALTEDSRASVRVLASRLGMAPSTVHARLRRLIETGIITRFTILIDPLMLGFEITALTLIQADGSQPVAHLLGHRLGHAIDHENLRMLAADDIAPFDGDLGSRGKTAKS